jgi:cytochrome b subunit of formate dehydrogenase
MPTDKIKRFKTSEIILHWMQAIPLLLLLLSGALMLITRASVIDLEQNILDKVICIHKIAAVAWLIFTLTSFTTNGIRANFGNLKEAHLWRPRDFKWIFSSIANLINPAIAVTPAEKFNAGQKLNILGVAFLLVVSSASGFIIWTHNTMLAAWYVHIACFCMAVVQVSGHIYMATLAPSTRAGLGGIFHGWVPKSYILHHHLLTLPPDERSDAHPPEGPAPRISVALRIALCGILLSCAVVTGIIFRSHIPSPATLLQHFNETIVMPGDLYLPHRNQVARGECMKCHGLTADMQNEKCLACHEKISDRMALNVGFHGTFSGECISCHTEHAGASGPIKPFNRDAFNHDLAAFRLQGKHRDVACEKCHRKTNDVSTVEFFIGHPHDTCTACHDDPHVPTLGSECTTCHTPQGWKGKDLLFEHNIDSDFKLQGKHRDVACDKCHRKTHDVSTVTSFISHPKETCAACHEDPHAPTLGSECTTCHTPQGWKGKDLLFEHNKHSAFTINALHSSVSCIGCHKDKKYKPMAATCKSCHSEYDDALKGTWHDRKGKPDAHAGCVKCIDCHDVNRRSQRNQSFGLRCAHCHHDGYARLYSDLQNSVLSRKTQLRRAIQLRAKAQGENQGSALNDLSQQLMDAGRVGAHNFQLTHALLDEVEQSLLRSDEQQE